MDHVCKKCKKTFKSKNGLTAHENRKNPCDLVHECKKCGHIFDCASKLKRHENSKVECSIVVKRVRLKKNQVRCEYCNRIYSCISALNRHTSNCVVLKSRQKESERIIAEKELLMLKNNEAQLNIFREVCEHNRKVMESNAELMEHIKENSSQKGHTFNNTFNNNLNITKVNGVDILPFGKENTTYITEADSRKMLASPEAKDVILKSMQNLYCNSEHPENMNVYSSGKNPDEVMIFLESKTWKKDSIFNVAPKMIDKSISSIIHWSVQPSDDEFVPMIQSLILLQGKAESVISIKSVMHKTKSTYIMLSNAETSP